MVGSQLPITGRQVSVVGCMYVCNNWNKTRVIFTSAHCKSVTVNLLDLAYRQ